MRNVSFKFLGRTRKGLTCGRSEDNTQVAVIFRMKDESGTMADRVEWFSTDDVKVN